MENENYTGPSPLINEKEEERRSQVKQDLEESKDPSAANSPRGDAEEEERTSLFEGEKDKMATSLDPTKVKFTNMMNHGGGDGGGGGNGEAKVDIENVQLSFAGMGKEELMKFADDPFWVRLRWSLFILFWAIWLGMLVGAVVIVLFTPGCPPPPERDWWHKGVVYQVYPQSFMDSNEDGKGDLKGIESKLDYIQDLGVNTIYLNPIYASPMKDGGYDISNFVQVDPVYGSMEDFKSLLNETKQRDIKVVMDFVPNHSSDQHPWFNKSKNNEPGFRDYYIWRDGSRPREPPSNWLSVFGGSAWTLDSKTSQYYLHQFSESQPDLNLRNPAVRKELMDILRFWLDLGVDGFRVDAIKHLFEDPQLTDERPSNTPGILAEAYESLVHDRTTNQPEIFTVLAEWRALLDSYKEKDGHHRLLVVEIYDDDLGQVMKYYGDKDNGSVALADFPFNFQLLKFKAGDGAKKLRNLTASWLDNMPPGAWPNWVLGNHDVSRFASRVSEKLVDAFNMVVMLIGGTPVTYYGEELGMSNGYVPYEELQDPIGKSHNKMEYEKYARDFARTPMQWNSSTYAGFSTVKPHLPVAANSPTVNVQVQLQDPNSHLNIYKKLVQLRKEPAIVYGDLHFLVNTEEIFSFARVKKGSPAYAVVINFGANDTVVDLMATNCCEGVFAFPDDGKVEIRSQQAPPADPSAKAAPKLQKVYLNKVELAPSEALLINFVPKFV